MTDRTPTPLIVIGGFLGAGKTTLLNHILAGNHGLRAGVIINDFGAVNIDAELVTGVEEDTIALSNGCVCCSIRGDLVSACLRMLDRADPPEIVFVEASGVSDPTEIARSLDLPALQPFLRIDSLVSVADAERLPALFDTGTAALARAQLQLADLVLLNKTDLISPDSLKPIVEMVATIAPRARIFPTVGARLPRALLATSSKEAGWIKPRSKEAGIRHAFETWTWRSDKPLSLPRLKKMLETLPSTVLRAKGIVWLEELAACRTILQMVGPRYNLRDDAPWRSARPASDIVLIGEAGALDKDALAQGFAGCLGNGNAAASPVLRLARRLAPHLTVPPPEPVHDRTRA